MAKVQTPETNAQNTNPKDLELIARASELLAKAATELKRRGCGHDHPIVSDALALLPRLRAAADRLNTRAKATAPPAPVPEKLHGMRPEQVRQLDLTNLLDHPESGPPEYTREELTEAAFTFENQLMALLGDETTMPWESYADLPRDQLVRIIQSAVENICRRNTGR